ncbi:MAG: 1-acyl-sn-glycerol-3-phosphate acyltransferase [Saprospiraceae bacterium]|nr:1-acyl-sn-glycerol-3-phosphate acyltransferase [Saprospiraceae bacterium]
MLYYWLKRPIRVAFKVFFRKVFIVNEELLPKGKPIIFASNHPTAFLDPILPASYLKRPLYFALRGDTFTSKMSKFFLAQVHCLPFFRFGDGFQSLRQNAATFKQIYSLLASGDYDFLIMAEGAHSHRKKLQPIQKGTANIAFGAWKKHQLDDLVIVPTGCNYTDSHQFRSWVTMKFGEPILLKDYLDVYQEDERKGVEELTEEIQLRLRKIVVHIEHDADDVQVNQLLDIDRNNRRIPVFPIRSGDSSMLKREIRIANVVNTMEQEDKVELFELLDSYQNDIRENGLSDLGLAQPNRYNLFNSVLLLLGFIPFLIGFSLNWPPFRICYAIVDRMAKKIEFHASLRFTFGMFMVPIWWLILFGIALIAGAGWWSFFVLLLPFLGYFALTYKELFEKWNAARKVRFNKKELTRKLTLRREDLLGRVDD